MLKTLVWNRNDVEPAVAAMLTALAEDFPIVESGEGVKLKFVKSAPGVSKVTLEDNTAVIEYGSIAAAGRGVGTALSGLEANENTYFDTFGIMLDVSRNGVMKLDHFKMWLRRLALLGYNMAMLYTEDTYKLPAEPYFGYMRGAYTFEEMKELDDYAASLGIEMIACIQTLGHMEQVIKWGAAYNQVTDTTRVLNVGEEATYKLIEKMLDFWGKAFRSRRIHIGMDETHDLGRGNFLDRYGYVNGFELFNRHLDRVNKMCAERGLHPMIWSDMYFRLGNPTQDYYDLNTNIPPEVRAKIPEGVELVYWDYYHSDYQFYYDFIKLHQELNRPVALGSGVWTWSKFWYDHVKTKATVVPGVKACRDTGVKNVFFTMWGDDGAFCCWDSALAGLTFAAEICYTGTENEDACRRRFAAICGGDFDAYATAGKLDVHREKWALSCYHLFWDDPILGCAWNYYKIVDPDFDQIVLNVYKEICECLADKRSEDGCADLNHPYLIADVVMKKLRFRKRLLAVYEAGDRSGAAELAAEIPDIIAAYTEIADSFRTVWHTVFKPFGYEVIQIRNGGQIARWKELHRKLLEYSAGTAQNIPELDEKLDSDIPALPIWYKGVATSTSIL